MQYPRSEFVGQVAPQALPDKNLKKQPGTTDRGKNNDMALLGLRLRLKTVRYTRPNLQT